MTEIRCIMLDLGKVIVNLDLNYFGDRMKRLADASPDELREAVLGDGLAVGFETGSISEADFHAQVCSKLGKQIPQEDFFAAWNSIFLPAPILPEDLLYALSRKAPLWALSNTNSAHFNYIADHFPLVRLFRGRILSYEVGLRKPDERIFRLALERADSCAAEALFVDDQAVNVEAALNVGMDAFQFVDPDQFIREMCNRRLL